MPKAKLPYGKKSITIDIPEDRLEDILVFKVINIVPKNQKGI